MISVPARYFDRFQCGLVKVSLYRVCSILAAYICRCFHRNVFHSSNTVPRGVILRMSSRNFRTNLYRSPLRSRYTVVERGGFFFSNHSLRKKMKASLGIFFENSSHEILIVLPTRFLHRRYKPNTVNRCKPNLTILIFSLFIAQETRLVFHTFDT